jgi:hypothetical protein
MRGEQMTTSNLNNETGANMEKQKISANLNNWTGEVGTAVYQADGSGFRFWFRGYEFVITDNEMIYMDEGKETRWDYERANIYVAYRDGTRDEDRLGFLTRNRVGKNWEASDNYVMRHHPHPVAAAMQLISNIF